LLFKYTHAGEPMYVAHALSLAPLPLPAGESSEVSPPKTSPQSTSRFCRPLPESSGVPMTRSEISAWPGSPTRMSPSAMRTAVTPLVVDAHGSGASGVTSVPCPVASLTMRRTGPTPVALSPKPMSAPGVTTRTHGPGLPLASAP
jgi:hypothetical protein